MLTKTDAEVIRKLIKEEVTDIVTDKVAEGNRSLRYEIRDMFGDFRQEINGKLTSFKSEILNHVDRAMGELVKVREEQTVMSGKLSEHSDTLEDHGKRIILLEKRILPN